MRLCIFKGSSEASLLTVALSTKNSLPSMRMAATFFLLCNLGHIFIVRWSRQMDAPGLHEICQFTSIGPAISEYLFIDGSPI